MNSYDHPRRSFHSESSESDVEVEQNNFRITANPGHVVKHDKYNESSESDISSWSEDQDQVVKPLPYAQNKRTIQVREDSQSEEDSEDSSGIDLIEQRIKRLEQDLQNKIDKQKKVQQVKFKQPVATLEKKPESKPQVIKNHGMANPPLPPIRVIEAYQPITQGGVIENRHTTSQNKNELNFIEREAPMMMKETMKPINSEVYVKDEPARKSPKRKESKKELTNKNSSITLEKSKASSKPRAKTQNNATALLNKAYKQIDDLHKVVEDLRHENHNLKEQLSKYRKKHSCEEVQKLKNISSGGDLKLQKQIETLKAIQQLQVKLKKSIAKKMKARGDSTQLT